MEAFINEFLDIFLVETRENLGAISKGITGSFYFKDSLEDLLKGSQKKFVKRSMGAFLNECHKKFLEESLGECLKHFCGKSVRVLEAIHARFSK